MNAEYGIWKTYSYYYYFNQRSWLVHCAYTLGLELGASSKLNSKRKPNYCHHGNDKSDCFWMDTIPVIIGPIQHHCIIVTVELDLDTHTQQHYS